TNPAIDPIREQIVMSLGTTLGPQGNLLEETPEHAHQIRVDHPVLTDAALASLRTVTVPGLRSVTLPMLFRGDSAERLQDGLDTLCDAALDAARSGCGVLILSDRGITPEW